MKIHTWEETVGDGPAGHVWLVSALLQVEGIAVRDGILGDVAQELGVVPGFDVAAVILVEVGQAIVDEDVALLAEMSNINFEKFYFRDASLLTSQSSSIWKLRAWNCDGSQVHESVELRTRLEHLTLFALTQSV